MNKEEIQQLITDTFNGFTNVQQFGFSKIPAHVHNGIDSNFVSFRDIAGRLWEEHACLPGTEPATAANYGVFYIASLPGTILAIAEAHGTAGTDAGAVTLQVEKLTGTQASGSGVSLLSSAFNLKAAANTVQYGLLASSVALRIKEGDRLGLVLSGTPTAVADLTVSIQITS